jgi:hypothetical protein
MSLLTLIREETIVANAAAGGEAYKYVTEQMLIDARSGAHSGKYLVTDFPQTERTGALLALQMQGFNAGFQDESHRVIYVYWQPRHPR